MMVLSEAIAVCLIASVRNTMEMHINTITENKMGHEQAFIIHSPDN